MKLFKWFKCSNRWKHLLGGVFIGVAAGSWFTALYSGIGVAGAMEMKDKLHGGYADPIDFILTVLGAIVGRGALYWASWTF